MHVSKHQRLKLESKTKRGFMMGYNDNSKAYRVFDPARWKLVITKDIVCYERKLGLTYLGIVSVPDGLHFPNSLTDSPLNEDHPDSLDPASDLEISNHQNSFELYSPPRKLASQPSSPKRNLAPVSREQNPRRHPFYEGQLNY